MSFPVKDLLILIPKGELEGGITITGIPDLSPPASPYTGPHRVEPDGFMINIPIETVEHWWNKLIGKE